MSRLAYWREAEARVVVDAWRRSGQRRSVFAAQYGIDVRRLGRWAARLGRSPAARVRFHPVRIIPPPIARSASSPSSLLLELVFPDGRLVRLPPGVAEADLRTVVAVLTASRPGC